MSILQDPSRLEFNKNDIFDNEIGTKIRNPLTAKPHWNGHFLLASEASLPKSLVHRRLIDGLEKTESKLRVDFIEHRDDRFREIRMKISAFICVYLRLY